MTEKVLDRKIGRYQSVPKGLVVRVEFAEMEPSMNISSQQSKWIRKLPISSPPSVICLVPVSTLFWHRTVHQFTRALPASKPSSEDPDGPCIHVLEQFVKKGQRGSLHGAGWSGEGVIRRSIPGWSDDDGASHRMNCDTPPLKGYCQGTLVPRCERHQTSDLNETRVPC